MNTQLENLIRTILGILSTYVFTTVDVSPDDVISLIKMGFALYAGIAAIVSAIRNPQKAEGVSAMSLGKRYAIANVLLMRKAA